MQYENYYNRKFNHFSIHNLQKLLLLSFRIPQDKLNRLHQIISFLVCKKNRPVVTEYAADGIFFLVPLIINLRFIFFNAVQI